MSTSWRMLSPLREHSGNNALVLSVPAARRRIHQFRENRRWLRHKAMRAGQRGGLLIVAITAYWQHAVVDDRSCPVATW